MGCSRFSLPSNDIVNGRDKPCLDEMRQISLSLDDDELEGGSSPNRDAINVGMAKSSIDPRDLLNEQRRLSTDVTRKLENRWLQSHFVADLEGEDVKLVKRRKTKCLYNHSKPHTVSPSLTTYSQKDHYHDNEVSLFTWENAKTPKY